VGVGADTDCVACEGNSYSAETGARSCVACPAESQATANKHSCVCNEGFTGAIQTYCIACEAGKYKSELGQMNCSACDVGKAHGQEGATSSSHCADCAEGTFASQMGTSTCELCPAGKYQGSAGATNCSLCQV
jgi:hypothetical protein